MQILATLTKPVKSGGQSTWDFIEKDDGTFAAIKRQVQEKPVADKQELREMYVRYLGYGFTEATF